MQSENTAVRRVNQLAPALLRPTITHGRSWQAVPGRPIIRWRQDKRTQLIKELRRAYTRSLMHLRCDRWSNQWGYTPVALRRRQAESKLSMVISLSITSLSHILFTSFSFQCYLNMLLFIIHSASPSLLFFIFALTQSYSCYCYFVVFFCILFFIF